MLRSAFDLPAKQIFLGNLLLIACCAFYLAWWLLAFRPVGAIKGMKTGWLLIPAFVLGVGAVLALVRGIGASNLRETLFPTATLLWGGAAAYLLLLAATWLLLRRPVTTELFLIVGWAVLTLSELNALYGTGRFSRPEAVIFSVIVGAAAVGSLVCYCLYYRLDTRAGYYDGCVPLAAAAAVMAALSVGMIL